jgi:drug/metabolite transporter (DMT)-like permease
MTGLMSGLGQKHRLLQLIATLAPYAVSDQTRAALQHLAKGQQATSRAHQRCRGNSLRMSQKSGGAAAFCVGGCLELAAAGISSCASERQDQLQQQCGIPAAALQSCDLTLTMTIPASGGPTTSDYFRGALCGLSAVCIWAAFIVVSRLGVSTGLTPWDVAAIRFAVAGVILLPYLLRRGLALDRLGWRGVAAIAIGCGAPMVLLVNAGLLFAPAAHGGALFPGVLPLMVALLAAAILKEAFTPQKTGGLILIVLGAVGIVWASGGTIGTWQNVGHALFLCAGLAWAGYTVAMRRARLDGLHAAAIAAAASFVLYLPIYATIAGPALLEAPLFDVTLQAVVQGILTAIVALLLYGRMVAILGATSGAAFVALTPAMTAGLPFRCSANGLPPLTGWRSH